MRKIVGLSPDTDDVIEISQVRESNPIFAKQDDKIVGMVIQENNGPHEGKWIIKLGGQSGATGHHPTLKDCLLSAVKYGYTFYMQER